MNSLLDFAAYILVKGVNRLFDFIPIGLILWFGRGLGALGFHFNKKRRLVAYSNLKAAFAREKSPHELKSLTKKIYMNLFEVVAEILSLTKVNKAYVDKYIEVVKMPRIEDAKRSGRGVILLTAHFGDWEMSSLVSAIKGFPILVLAREQKMERVNELLNKLRESKGCTVVRKGTSTKLIIKALHEKEMVGILADQDAGKNGVFVDFFGRPASFNAGPMEIARRTDSIILPNFIARTHGPYNKLYLEEYIDFRSVKEEGIVKKNIRKYANLLESYVRKYPEQWLWLHKRWKSTPVRTVLVLNDGKRGHLNQSLAIAHAIQKVRTAQGYDSQDTKIITLDAKYRNKFARSLLSLSALSATWRCHGCMKCLKVCLEKDCYNALISTYADFVVSCGSSLAPINILISKENNARNIAIMKPAGFGPGKFSLLIVPEHDRPINAPNILKTTLAPSLINAERLKDEGEILAKRFGLGMHSDYVGMLIGGDNPEFTLTKERMDEIIEDALRFCGETGACLIVTTSRRTPPEVEAVIKNRLKGDRHCTLAIIANEKNVEGAVGGILGLSRVALVSGESISMVSEAISARKPTVVFALDRKRRGMSKHERAMKGLEDKGCLTIAERGELCEKLKRAWTAGRVCADINDSEKIVEAVRRLI